MKDRRNDEPERMLRAIENHVMEEVWIGRVRRAAGVAVTLALVGTATVWWEGRGSPHVGNDVVTVTVAVFLLASTVSGLALALRRYRWCCAAAYCCGLAAVIGIGAFWWLWTGRTGMGLSWLVLADLAAVALTLGWLAVIVTPIERSQPDIEGCLLTEPARESQPSAVDSGRNLVIGLSQHTSEWASPGSRDSLFRRRAWNHTRCIHSGLPHCAPCRSSVPLDSPKGPPSGRPPSIVSLAAGAGGDSTERQTGRQTWIVAYAGTHRLLVAGCIGLPSSLDSGKSPVGDGDGPGGREEPDDDESEVVGVDGADPVGDGPVQPRSWWRTVTRSTVPIRLIPAANNAGKVNTTADPRPHRCRPAPGALPVGISTHPPPSGCFSDSRTRYTIMIGKLCSTMTAASHPRMLQCETDSIPASRTSITAVQSA